MTEISHIHLHPPLEHKAYYCRKISVSITMTKWNAFTEVAHCIQKVSCGEIIALLVKTHKLTEISVQHILFCCSKLQSYDSVYGSRTSFQINRNLFNATKIKEINVAQNNNKCNQVTFGLKTKCPSHWFKVTKFYE